MDRFEELIENVDSMPYESQEIFIDIINKKFSEIKRRKFVEETIKSKDEREKGDYIEGGSQELFNCLKI